jgi:hypothetical protein
VSCGHDNKERARQRGNNEDNEGADYNRAQDHGATRCGADRRCPIDVAINIWPHDGSPDDGHRSRHNRASHNGRRQPRNRDGTTLDSSRSRDSGYTPHNRRASGSTSHDDCRAFDDRPRRDGSPHDSSRDGSAHDHGSPDDRRRDCPPHDGRAFDDCPRRDGSPHHSDRDGSAHDHGSPDDGCRDCPSHDHGSPDDGCRDCPSHDHGSPDDGCRDCPSHDCCWDGTAHYSSSIDDGTRRYRPPGNRDPLDRCAVDRYARHGSPPHHHAPSRCSAGRRGRWDGEQRQRRSDARRVVILRGATRRTVNRGSRSGLPGGFSLS